MGLCGRGPTQLTYHTKFRGCARLRQDSNLIDGSGQGFDSLRLHQHKSYNGVCSSKAEPQPVKLVDEGARPFIHPKVV